MTDDIVAVVEAKKWYVIHTYSGYEGKVKTMIEDSLQKAGFQDKIGKILVPTEEVMEVKGGKKKISSRKFFPGYILVEMDMDYDVWYLVKNTPKVTGFLGGENTPTPLSVDEVEQLLGRIEKGESKPKPKVLFDKGEQVRIIDGPFINFNGVVEEVNPERGKVKLMVSIFGRTTPLELEIPQIERV